jgi:hypothetical protein
MTEIQKYMGSLRKNPGLPIAIALTLILFVVVQIADDWILRAAVVLIFWLIVLWSAWEMRK